MKQLKLLILLTLLMSMVGAKVYAHDLEYNGIYYRITDNNFHFVSVTYKGNSYNEYANEYYGDIVIPMTFYFYGEDGEDYYIVTGIDSYAFRDCSGLRSVRIGEEVSAGPFGFIFGDGIFMNCSNLSSVYFSPVSKDHSSLWDYFYIDIGSKMFYGCSSLTSISIPEGVSLVDGYAFYGCNNLNTVVIPSTVTDINFNGCNNITKVIVKSEQPMNIHCYIPYREKATLYVPAGCIEAYKSAESWQGFKDIVELRDIVFADATVEARCVKYWDTNNDWKLNEEEAAAVTQINQEFRYMSYFTSFNELKYFSGLKIIGDDAFYSCSSLESITIPAGVTSIGNNAFFGCGLTTITIEVQTPFAISETVFSSNTYTRATLIVPKGSKAAYQASYPWSKFTNIVEGDSGEEPSSNDTSADESSSCGDGLTYTFTESTGTLTISKTSEGTGKMTNYNYNDGAWTEIPWDSFRDKISNIILNDGVTSIGNCAFHGCYNLTSVTIPNSVISIGDHAFYYCRGLTSLTIPNSVTTIGDWGFSWCTGLTSLTIPNSVTTIGEGTFHNCSGLTSLTIPNSVTSIGFSAFGYCSDLTSVTIPNSVSSIGVRAFESCYSLTSITMPNSVISISDMAFMNCSKLTSVTIPNSVTNIGSDAFSGCGLTSVIIPNSVTFVDKGAFAGCSNLTSVTIPNSVTSIEQSVFLNCGLQSVTIPNSVTSIGGSAFSHCRNLSTVIIPNSVTSIGECAFMYCDGLISVTIPNSVTSIGGRAFEDCHQLSSITIDIKTPFAFGYKIFDSNTYTTATLIVPQGSKAAYQATEGWKNFTNIVESGGGDDEPQANDNNQIVVNGVSVNKGKTATFAIGLSNETTDLSAYQFDLTLPAGITLSKNDKGKFQVSKSDRYADDSQTLNVSAVEGSSNTYRFVCFSLSNSVIEGTSGAILNAIIEASNTVSPGTYEAQISNVVFTKSNGTQLTLNSVNFNIVVNNVIKGDANDDGEINVADIVEIVNYILGKPSAKFVEAAADLNDDGEINVTDIVKVVSIIMSGNNVRQRSAMAESTDHDRLTLTENENHALSLSLDNEGSYVATQFDVHLSAGQTLEGIRLNNNRSKDHILSYTKIGNSVYRVIVYSLGNQAYAGNCGELLSIQVSGMGHVDIDNILFVTSGQKEKRFEPMYSYISTAIKAVENTESMDVYSVDGRLVRKQVMSTDDLKKGIYIINGKKHIVR